MMTLCCIINSNNASEKTSFKKNYFLIFLYSRSIAMKQVSNTMLFFNCDNNQISFRKCEMLNPHCRKYSNFTSPLCVLVVRFCVHLHIYETLFVPECSFPTKMFKTIVEKPFHCPTCFICMFS